MNEALSAALSFAIAYGGFKDWLIEVLGLSRDALHIHIGLALFFVVVLLLRERTGGTRPWLTVLALTLLGEVADYSAMAHDGNSFVPAVHAHDIWNTMLWPTVLTAWGRWRRRSRV